MPQLTKKNLEAKLRTFRKKKSISMNVPAYYIFTDEELNNLLEVIPKTIEELKSSNLLPNIKIKCHGEEIIKLLNDQK